jgi:hypothetical protein
MFYFNTVYAAVGFSSGNSFETLNLAGSGTVHCLDSGKTRAFSCNSNYLFPAEYDYFGIDQDLDADKVILTAMHEDGSEKTKKQRYSSKNRRTKYRVNLWIKSLTQRPLLNVGKNKISYKLTKKGDVVSFGEFLVEVSTGEQRVCEYDYITATNDIYCEDIYRTCELYFYKQNYCQ